ncbi:insulinase family protein [Myxococcota bacterium]|nr:insulinase family protein [Myxococcota bacterium]
MAHRRDNETSRKRDQSASVEAYEHRVGRLDNGLTIVTVATPHLHVATVSVFARVGSRHETAETNGLSHFLEHMFFRGCDGFPDSTTLNAAMEDLGGYLDGYTTRDYSGYHSTVHPDYVAEATQILGHIMRGPKFSEIEIERSIILEEILDALDHRGREIELDTIAHRDAFPGHPLGNSIDGPRANLKRFSHDDLHAHRKRFYGAKNLVVCFAGRIDPRACFAHAKKYFGPLFAGRRATEGRPPALPEKAPRFRFVRTDDSQTRARLTFRATSDAHKDYPALLLLRRILDGGLSARLQVELVEKRGIVYDIGAELEAYSDCGLFDFELAAQHKKLAYAIEELGKVISGIAAHGVSQEELDRVRRRARIGLEFGLDSTSELSGWFGATQLFHAPIPPEVRMRQLEAITPADVARVARRYFAPSRLTMAAVGGASQGDVRDTKQAMKRLVATLDALH